MRILRFNENDNSSINLTTELDLSNYRSVKYLSIFKETYLNYEKYSNYNFMQAIELYRMQDFELENVKHVFDNGGNFLYSDEIEYDASVFVFWVLNKRSCELMDLLLDLGYKDVNLCIDKSLTSSSFLDDNDIENLTSMLNMLMSCVVKLTSKNINNFKDSIDRLQSQFGRNPKGAEKEYLELLNKYSNPK